MPYIFVHNIDDGPSHFVKLNDDDDERQRSYYHDDCGRLRSVFNDDDDRPSGSVHHDDYEQLRLVLNDDDDRLSQLVQYDDGEQRVLTRHVDMSDQDHPEQRFLPLLMEMLGRLQLGQERSAQESREMVQQLAANIASNIAAITPPPPPPAPKPKERLPKLTPFSGNRNTFEDWEIKARNKLHQDGPAIGDDQSQLQYLFACLENEARSMCIAWFRQHEETSTGFNLLDYIKAIYGDPNLKERALDRLLAIEQKKNESFAKFIPKFEGWEIEARNKL